MRVEQDLLGTREIPTATLTGIAHLRAAENFNLSRLATPPVLFHAFGAVKLACANTNAALGYLDAQRANCIAQAAQEMRDGFLDSYLCIDALQGGAGTSTNLVVCEVIANRALEIAHKTLGDYDYINPLEHVNLHQSTNDTYPTALRVAALWLLHRADSQLLQLVDSLQNKEREFAEVVKLGRTEMQDAVLTTLGRSFGAFADALARDRWRVARSIERIRVVNLGGTAIGTGFGAPQSYIFKVTDELRACAKVNVSRAENLVDATQNCDSLVEVMGILKAWASNLIKISNDLRLLSSGPQGGLGEIILPVRQPGSTIMPGKVNPVIPESVVQAGLLVFGMDHSLTTACAMGNLELNAFLPLVSYCLLTSIEILGNASENLATLCIKDICACPNKCMEHAGTAFATALAGKVGYKMAETYLMQAQAEGVELKVWVVSKDILSASEAEDMLSAARALRLGSF